MGLIDTNGGLASTPTLEAAGARVRPRRLVSEFESEIRRLYLRMLDEPIPARFIGILRSGLTTSKS